MKNLPELKNIAELKNFQNPLFRCIELAQINTPLETYPILGFVIGPDDPTLPTLGLFGGVHGLERIGTHIVTAFLKSFLTQLQWDQDLVHTMKHMRIVSIPLINPGGMAMIRRSNPNGVDLNRNSPTEATSLEKLPYIMGGHRISNHLPWYRGLENAPMEKEALTLIDFVKNEIFPSRYSLAVDFHSGFGMVDRLWYPYAKSTEEFPKFREVIALKKLLDLSLPHHIYSIEAQSKSYTTHGDLWDHMFDQHLKLQNNNIFIPWTLELGSWNWVKKNPKQIFSLLGMFNPVVQHRHDRAMRRHKSLLDFLVHAVRNHQTWN